ncbi:hypothetical protein D6764_03275 [Candidatus Woesearchaeota archaeon]|nr:MAG: hypothetical protein D6764_03275 [Candidatus Woesearchaeota archaeon]
MTSSLPDMSSFEVMHISSELQFLVGARVNKIYQPSKNVFHFVLHVPSKGRFVLSLIIPKLAFVSPVKESSDVPSGFCMALRKRLVSSRLRSLSQLGFDRVLRLEFEKETSFFLFVELFSKGNLVLSDSQSKILLSLVRSSSRDFRPGSSYEAPPPPTDPRTLSLDEFVSLYSPGAPVEKWLASSMSLGKKYAREVCFNAGIEPSEKNVSRDALSALFNSMKNLLSRSTFPNAVLSQENKLVAVSPVMLEHLAEGHVVKSFSSFSEALSFAVYDVLKYSSVAEEESPVQRNVEKQLKMIEMQKDRVKSLLEEAEENSRTGELIYENYQLISDFLSEVRAKKEALSTEEFASFLKSHPLVSSFDLKNRTVKIKIP